MGLVFRGVSEGRVVLVELVVSVVLIEPVVSPVLVELVDEMEASAGVEMISVSSSNVPKNSLYN